MKNSLTQQTSSSVGIQSEWFKHLRDPADREEFRKLLLNNNNHPVLKRLYLILVSKLDAINQTQTKSNYNSSAWAYLLAHTNGERQMLQEIIDLLSFIDGPKR